MYVMHLKSTLDEANFRMKKKSFQNNKCITVWQLYTHSARSSMVNDMHSETKCSQFWPGC